jgi:hypothetical protein
LKGSGGFDWGRKWTEAKYQGPGGKDEAIAAFGAEVILLFLNKLVWDGRAVERFDWDPAGGVGGGSTNHIDIHFLRSFITDDRVSFYSNPGVTYACSGIVLRDSISDPFFTK